MRHRHPIRHIRKTSTSSRKTYRFDNEEQSTTSSTSPPAAQLAADAQRQCEIDAQFLKEARAETDRWNKQ